MTVIDFTLHYFGQLFVNRQPILPVAAPGLPIPTVTFLQKESTMISQIPETAPVNPHSTFF
jgi:hypothetical protein